MTGRLIFLQPVPPSRADRCSRACKQAHAHTLKLFHDRAFGKTGAIDSIAGHAGVNFCLTGSCSQHDTHNATAENVEIEAIELERL